MVVDGENILNDERKKQMWNQSTSGTWDIGGTTHDWRFGYYFGYISDLMVFNSALSNEDIGKTMSK